ncbi:fidipidine, putative, partial [Ixodes scapularis]
QVHQHGDQSTKMQEISELLVAAGYFRARIKGLSPFDKIVGGLAWGIELCAVDIDVDLPFNENLNIGQKIALTEKIVRVLPKMKCPHRIEPHQIQGLDFEHIFPVVQWLVKKAIETKAETEDIHREYAVYLFEKVHGDTPQETLLKMTVGNCLQCHFKIRYRPRRRYRHHARHTLRSEELQVEATLLEYGTGMMRQPTAAGDAGADARQVWLWLVGQIIRADQRPCHVTRVSRRHETRAFRMVFLTFLGEASPNQFPITGFIKKLLSTEGGNLSSSYHAEVLLQEAREATRRIAEGVGDQEPQLARLCALLRLGGELSDQEARFRQHCHQEMERLQADLAAITPEVLLQEAREATRRIAEGVGDQEPQLARLCALLRLGGELSDQEARFRQHCHQEMERLQADLAAITPGGADGGTALPAADPEDREADAQCQRDRDRLQRMRLLLAKKNREIAATQRKIDEVPSRAELSQYQRRFIELYTQVAATHRETKQFYTLYNTLDDIRMYLDKEVRIFGTLTTTSSRAMTTPATRDQFLAQFEHIVEGVKQNRLKVEKKRQEAKMSRDRLHDHFLELVDKQRLYFRTVKEFKEECRKNEVLVGKLKESSAK